MSRAGEIRLPFGDDDRDFRLGLKELRKLQEKCGERGPFRILRDLQSGDGRVEDIVETIRLGLIGGGMKEEDAARLVKQRFEDRIGLHEHTLTAMLILNAAIIGPDEDRIDPGKASGEQAVATTGSASPPSTGREPSSDGPRETSIN